MKRLTIAAVFAVALILTLLFIVAVQNAMLRTVATDVRSLVIDRERSNERATSFLAGALERVKAQHDAQLEALTARQAQGCGP